eukprot:17514_1
MKRKLEENDSDITSKSNPHKKQKLTPNEAIIKKVNGIYSLHTTYEMLSPHWPGSHPYHIMHFRYPQPYTIFFNQFKSKQIKQIESYYNTPNKSQTADSILTFDEFEWKTIDREKQQITNEYGDAFLQRTQRIILNDVNQMKIINDLVYDLKQLSIPWNSEEFRCKCS